MSFRDLRTRWQSLRRRRLAFEALEHRDLLTAMRIVDWNAANFPNTAAQEANFRTILQAIGNETVQGNTDRISILALQETDGPSDGGSNSIGQIQSILNSLYPTTTYSYAISPLFTGDSTGFVYDTSSVTLLESVNVTPPTPLQHSVIRGKFQPVGAPASSVFYVYSIHLQSGDSSGFANDRAVDAASLRADADALGEGAQVLFVGDFNMYTSAEVAYSNFLASGPAQLQDVADAPGDWEGNAAFLTLHSHDGRTGGSGMNDRFDIQFATGEFFDGIGLEYVANSYHVFGNNGTHALNGPINGNGATGASPTVLNALAASTGSDHLPLVVDYQFLPSTPNVRISQTAGSTKVVEGGFDDSYQIVLDTVPTADVTVTVQPVNTPSPAQLDVGNGSGNSISLTFTPANALTPQTVVVHAVNDADPEGDHFRSIEHTSSSSDLGYNGLSIASVNVRIVDNDAPTIVINEVDADPNGTDTTEFVELYDGGVGNASLDGYFLVFFNGNDGNNGSYRSVNLTGKHTNSTGFFVVGDSALIPAPDLNFTSASNSIEQGPDGIGLYKYTAAELLITPNPFPSDTSPTTSHLRDAIVYTTAAGLNTIDQDLIDALNPGHPQIDEDQKGSGATQSLSRIPDGSTAFDTSANAYTAQTPTPSTYNLPSYGMLILQSGSHVDVQEGGATDTYQLALNSIPTGDVQIRVTPDGQTNLGNGPGAYKDFTFTPADALIPKTVTVTAVDDAIAEGNHISILTHTLTSTDTHYNGLSVSNVVANIVDNDVVPESIVISEIMYDPDFDESTPGVGEWIEVVNTGAAQVNLAGWLFDDEDSTNWGAIPATTPLGVPTLLSPKQVAVFFDSALTDETTFRTVWNVPANALVVPISWGSLKNTQGPGDEVVVLLKNGTPMDTVDYDSLSPWPSDQNGKSVYLKNLSSNNNVGSNWALSVVGTAKAVSATGSPYTGDVGSPGRFFLGGDFSANASVDAADYVMWRKTLGTNDPATDQSGPTTGVPNGVVDQYDYVYWRANFGSEGAITAPSLGASALAGASSLGEPTDATVSEPQPLVALNSESAVDTAITQFTLAPIASASTTSTSPTSPPTTQSEQTSSANELLLALRNESVSQSWDDSYAIFDHASDQDADAIDEYFASLDDGDFAEQAGALSAVL